MSDYTAGDLWWPSVNDLPRIPVKWIVDADADAAEDDDEVDEGC